MEDKINEIIDYMKLKIRKSGCEIEEFDLENGILKLNVPKESFEYEFSSPEILVSNIKNNLIILGIFGSNCSVKYKLSDVKWTEKLANKIK